MKLTPTRNTRLPIAEVELVRLSHATSIAELQSAPFAGGVILPNVVLVDSTPTTIAHGLGRLPSYVSPSPPRGGSSNGSIQEIRDGTQDRTKVVVLEATGWGATVTVDVVVT